MTRHERKFCLKLVSRIFVCSSDEEVRRRDHTPGCRQSRFEESVLSWSLNVLSEFRRREELVSFVEKRENEKRRGLAGIGAHRQLFCFLNQQQIMSSSCHRLDRAAHTGHSEARSKRRGEAGATQFGLSGQHRLTCTSAPSLAKHSLLFLLLFLFTNKNLCSIFDKMHVL